jgi:hypothetical protein
MDIQIIFSLVGSLLCPNIDISLILCVFNKFNLDIKEMIARSEAENPILTFHDNSSGPFSSLTENCVSVFQHVTL